MCAAVFFAVLNWYKSFPQIYSHNVLNENYQYSWTLLSRTLKGNEKHFKIVGEFKLAGSQGLKNTGIRDNEKFDTTEFELARLNSNKLFSFFLFLFFSPFQL